MKTKMSPERLERHRQSFCEAITQLSKEGEFIKHWRSASEAALELGINQSNICQCCLGNRKTAGNFTWKYKG